MSPTSGSSTGRRRSNGKPHRHRHCSAPACGSGGCPPKAARAGSIPAGGTNASVVQPEERRLGMTEAGSSILPTSSTGVPEGRSRSLQDQPRGGSTHHLHHAPVDQLAGHRFPKSAWLQVRLLPGALLPLSLSEIRVAGLLEYETASLKVTRFAALTTHAGAAVLPDCPPQSCATRRSWSRRRPRRRWLPRLHGPPVKGWHRCRCRRRCRCAHRRT